ncbi:MAG: OadG family protein [Candidatus Muiribacteriota bacterium]
MSSELILKGLSVSVTGVVVVFSILILISVVIYLLQFLNPELRKNKVKASLNESETESNKQVSDEEVKEEEIIAVISAAVSVLFSGRNFSIKSVREAKNNLQLKHKNLNMWGKYGRMNVMTTHQNFGKGRLR